MKKRISLLLALAVLVSCLCGCGATIPEETLPAQTEPTETEPAASLTEEALAYISTLGSSPDDNYRVWYEVFLYAFCDSNGDGIGDINGLRSKLDYLQELGVTGIWLMPIHPSTSYHKYNVSDYYAIDPDYGTMDDFEALLAECEERGIRVIIDLVVNHSGSDHEWFQTACEYLAGLSAEQSPDPAVCPYVEYYNFTEAPGSGCNNVPGSTRFYYECQFSSDMPDLNWGCEALREDIRQIMEFWLDKGVAGFRLDAAKEFYSGNSDRNIEVLSWLQTTAESIREDAYLVAEVWDNAATVTSYYESGITSIFSYPYGDNSGRIALTVRGAGRENIVGTFATSLESWDAGNRENNPDYIDASFLSNHDVGRIMGFVARDVNKAKLAAAINLLISGSSFIYYGEEIGMVCGAYDDPSYRAPMYWSSEETEDLCDPAPGCTVPDTYPLGSLADQVSDDASLYNYYRQAIAIRNALPVISHGAVTAETALNNGCVVAIRKTWEDEACVILMNVDTEAAQVDLTDYTDWTVAVTLSAEGGEITREGTTLMLSAYGIAILLPNG